MKYQFYVQKECGRYDDIVVRSNTLSIACEIVEEHFPGCRIVDFKVIGE